MTKKKKKKKKNAGRKAAPPPSAGYFAATRRLSASYIFVAPLFAIYQGALALDGSVRNGTAWIFSELLAPLREYGLVFVNCIVLGLLLVAIARMRKDRARYPFLYGWMFLESLLWTAAMVALARVVAPVTLALPPFTARLVSGAGAGVYEEVLFRFLLMGGLILVLHRALGGRLSWVVPLAVVTSSLLFSLAHHRIGGEPWDRGVFWYRAAMGGLLGVIFWARGLGIVVYTHALYNVTVLIWDHIDG